MTWEELKEKAINFGYLVSSVSGIETLEGPDIIFYVDGDVDVGGTIVASMRTPEQMLMIMEGLR